MTGITGDSSMLSTPVGGKIRDLSKQACVECPGNGTPAAGNGDLFERAPGEVRTNISVRPDSNSNVSSKEIAQIREDVSLQQNIDFLIASMDLWYLDTQQENYEKMDADRYISLAGKLLEQYRVEGLPAQQFAHTDDAVDTAFFVMDEALRMMKAAGKYTKTPADFHDQVEMHFIDIRLAMNAGCQEGSINGMRETVPAAVDNAIESMKEIDPDAVTASELKIVLAAVYRWQEILDSFIKEGDTPAHVANKADQAFSRLEVELRPIAPSERSYETALFVVKAITQLYKSLAVKTQTLEEMSLLGAPHMDAINQALKQGLMEKSLDSIRSNVDHALQEALAELGKGEQETWYLSQVHPVRRQRS